MARQDPPRPEGRKGESSKPAAQSAMLARVLDDLVTIPGTNIGIGLDGLIGLVPGVGDSLTTTLGGAIMIDAVRRRVPTPVLARMALNLLVDTALGFIPLIGDAADFVHRANRKNYRLLRAAIEKGQVVDEPYPQYMVKAVGLVIGTLVIMIATAAFALWFVITVLMRVLG